MFCLFAGTDDLSFYVKTLKLTNIYERKAANEISKYLLSLRGNDKFENFLLENMSYYFTIAVNSERTEIIQRLSPKEIDYVCKLQHTPSKKDGETVAYLLSLKGDDAIKDFILDCMCKSLSMVVYTERTDNERAEIKRSLDEKIDFINKTTQPADRKDISTLNSLLFTRKDESIYDFISQNIHNLLTRDTHCEQKENENKHNSDNGREIK